MQWAIVQPGPPPLLLFHLLKIVLILIYSVTHFSSLLAISKSQHDGPKLTLPYSASFTKTKQFPTLPLLAGVSYKYLNCKSLLQSAISDTMSALFPSVSASGKSSHLLNGRFCQLHSPLQLSRAFVRRWQPMLKSLSCHERVSSRWVYNILSSKNCLHLLSRDV